MKARFKEFRRVTPATKNKPTSATNKKSPVRKPPGISSHISLPEVMPGEDKFSFSQHNKLLKAELSKSKPNKIIISEIMDLSFAMRRQDIANNGYTGVSALFDIYPALQDYDQVRHFNFKTFYFLFVRAKI